MMNPREAAADMQRSIDRYRSAIAGMRGAADSLRRLVKGREFASGGYVPPRGGEVRQRILLHDHDGRACEIVGGVHYAILTPAEVREAGRRAARKTGAVKA